MEVDHPPRPQQLVYEPQSIATPVKSASSTANAIAEDAVDAKANAVSSSTVESRRRKRRSFFNSSKQSPVPAKSAKRKSIANNNNKNSAGLLPGERRACLTEILWEDVQKAKELLGFRQKAAADATPIPVECPQVPTPSSMQQHPVIARMMSHPASTSSGMSQLHHHHLHQQHHHHPGGHRFAPIAILEEVENQPRSTASLPGRRSHRHRRASSDLAVSSTPAAATVEAAADAGSPPDSLMATGASGVASLQLQQQQAVEHQRRVSRFWELKRLLVELNERKAEKLRQLALLEAKEKSLAGDFGCSTIGKSTAESFLSQHGGSHHSLDANCSQLSQQQQQQLPAVGESEQLCFPTQYLVAFEHDEAQSELLQLQEEAAVQRALVEANARLVRECQTDKATRPFKRKRVQEHQRSQERLRMLNQRIAEIRARDSAASFASAYCTQTTGTASSACSGSGDTAKTSEGAFWKQPSSVSTTSSSATATVGVSGSLSLPALRRQQVGQQQQQQLSAEHPMRMQLSFRHRPHLHGVTTMISHAGSIDSGFQDLQSETSCFGVSSASSASSLVNGNNDARLARQISDQSLHFRPIDDDQEGEGAAAVEGSQDEDMSGVY